MPNPENVQQETLDLSKQDVQFKIGFNSFFASFKSAWAGGCVEGWTVDMQVAEVSVVKSFVFHIAIVSVSSQNDVYAQKPLK